MSKQYISFKILLLCIIIGLSTANMYGQPNTTLSHQESNQFERDFSGMKWRMKMMLPGEGIKRGLHKLPSEDIETLVWNNAEVPGDVYTDLWKAGAIEDPYFGRNSVKAQWVQQYEWWYAYQFQVTEGIEDQVVDIVFEGVDYSCEVWLNGHYLGKNEGAFSGFSFNVNDYLRINNHDYLKGQNMLIVKINPAPQVNALVAGKKTPWFGDYWRDIAPMGIWRPVKMVRSGKVRFKDVYAKTKINKNGSADVTMEMTIENTDDASKKMNFIISLEGKNFESEKLEFNFNENITRGTHKVTKTIHIDNPKLWWPWDLGDPNLYQAKISLKEGQVNHDINETTFGIREVTSKWNPGFEKGVDVSFPRSTYINGKFHFIRSACWGGPPDIFVGRTSPEEYYELIKMAKEMNMNNIRIFGWHPPEIPEFYQYADEMGMTIWQDMIPLGTGNFPIDEEHVSEIFNEAVKVVKERRNHPSLIMMEGGEEMMFRTRDPHAGRKFLERLGDSLQAYVPLPYVPDSPMTDHVAQEAGFKPKEAVHALRYFYDMGEWLHEDWYQTKADGYPIVPEFAITSVPSVESLRKFIPEDELWKPGLSWGHHWADLTRLRMQNWDVFGDEMKGSLEEFVNATQDAQGIIFQNGIEHFRRDKPSLSAIALCHYITYWPDMKWGIVDNYQKPKRSYYYVQKAYQPLLVNFEFKKRRWHTDEPFLGNIWVINDFYTVYKNCTINFTIKNDKKNTLFNKTYDVAKIDENSARKFFEINQDILGKVKEKFYVELELLDSDGNQISHNDYFFLIGDQEVATKHFQAWKEERLKQENENGHGGYGSYYFFFDEFTRENGKDYESGTQTPRAKGF
ncbi:beta-galactosidase/beta-glucuronidase [Galbibacter orientalis DSM 19592]|uniref:Beta-mannosidase B n=1 Tax=Galbibacter orientalis DSM 19592 TaxID=926559 RepID=I3CAS5_9FLAO|nr:sugar-binding domain-containing protein [Galbibacter orientalis]EIJ40718.1 beta-galactosidase/beta-glucuronidase [Galbibacter orientalis DSM 19592]